MKIYPIFIPHAGCPHRCLFCAQDKSSGQAVVPGVAEVNAFLDKALPPQGDGEIAFYGGSFSALPYGQQDLYLTTAARFIATGRASGVRISTRPDALATECVERLISGGVTTIEIGCQSFDPFVLMSSARGHSVSDSVSAVQRCREAGVAVGLQLMPGLPGSSGNEALLSLQRALDLNPDFMRIYPTVVLDGTRLADLWRSGDYQPWPLDKAVDTCADMLLLCRLVNMPIIRLGLQSDPHLEKNLLAGPYHPAFGQLVRSRIWRRALLQAGCKEKLLTVHPHDLSDVMGHRGENRTWLIKHNPEVHVITDNAVGRGSLRVAGRDLPLTSLSAPGGLHG